MKNFTKQKAARLAIPLVLLFSFAFTYDYVEHHPFVVNLITQLNDYSADQNEEKVYVQLDRNFYQPGEEIWFKVYIKNANDLTSKNVSNRVNIELYDPKGSPVAKEKLLANNGLAKGVFKLNAGVGGIYKIKAYTNWQKNSQMAFERTVQVQKVVLPNLNMKLDFERKAYGAGDTTEAKLELQSLDNQALRYADFKYIVQIEGKEILRKKEQADFEGNAMISFELPKELNSSDALLQVLIPHKGMTESISRAVPIVLNNIDLQFFPEGGDMVAGLKTKMAFKALNEFGKPVDVQGEIFNDKDELIHSFKSFHDGMGSFDFYPDRAVKYYAKITKPEGIEKVYHISAVKTRGYSLNIINQNEEHIEVAVRSTRYAELHLVAQSKDVVTFSKNFKIDGQEIVKIPISDFPMGISRLTLFDNSGLPQCERLVFVNLHKRLQISVKTNKEKYMPREKVVMDIEVKDENGKPVSGNFSLSVADSKLLTFADDKQGHIFSKIFLESELKGRIEEPDFYFDKEEPKAIAGLDLLMMTHGWRRFEWKAVQSQDPVAFEFKKEDAVMGGKVVDECGKPVADAWVTINGTKKEVRTNKLGDFRLHNVPLKPQGNSIRIEAEGRPTIVKSIVDYRKDFYIIQAEGSGVIVGKILDPKGKVINYAQAELFDDAGSKWIAHTDKKRGEYAFHQVPTGEYTLRFSYIYSNHRAHQVERVRVWPGEEINISRKLRSHSEKAQIFVSKYDEEMERANAEWLAKKELSLTVPQKEEAIIAEVPVFEERVTFKSISGGGGGVQLDEIVMVEYKVPLIEQDNTIQGGKVTSEEIAVLPTKNINALAASMAGITQADEGDALSIRGSRAGNADVYVDGIRVRSSMISVGDIEQLTVITGGLPASFGGGTAVIAAPVFMPDPKFGRTNEIEMNRHMFEYGNPLAYEEQTGSSGALTTSSGGGSTYYRGGRYNRGNLYYYPNDIFNIVDQRPRLNISRCERLWDKAACVACADDYLENKIKSALEKVQTSGNQRPGTAMLYFYVDKKGKVGGVCYQRQSGYYNSNINSRLHATLQKLDKNWFPATRKGKKVAAWYAIPISYGSLDQQYPVKYTPVREFYAPQYKDKQTITKRTDFRSTIYWNPNVEVGKNGKAQLEFWNSDDLSTFTTTIEGFSNNGLVGATEHNHFIQMPFSMLAKTPTSFTVGDAIRIPIILTNNTDETIEGKLAVRVPQCFNLIQAVDENYILAAGESRTVYPEYEVSQDCPRGKSKQIIEVAFTSSGIGDAFVQSIEVNSSSFPIYQLFTGDSLSNVFDLQIRHPSKGSLQLKLEAHPNVITEAMSSLERMLRQPSGCFEQTSSSTYPNLLVLNYMKKHPREFNRNIKERAEKYLDAGYKRLTGYEVKGGGYQWFGRAPAHEGLTAYGVLEFTDMKAVYPVDEKMLERTTDWLLSRRDGKGSWTPGPGALHRWNGSAGVRDAYIVWALSEAGLSSKIKPELEKSYKDALKTKDPYVMALVSNAFFQMNDTRGQALLDSLLSKQLPNGSFIGKSASITASKGKNLRIETTALSMLAMMDAKDIPESQLQKAAKFIAKSKSNYGFGSTQSTILALKALIEYADFHTTQQPGNGALQLFVNHEAVGPPITFSKNQTQKIVVPELEQYIVEGEQQIEVRFTETDQSIPFELHLSYTSKIPQLQESECKLALKTEMKKQEVMQGETIRLTTLLTNKTDEVQSSPLAIIGIPNGLSPQPWQLKEIQEKFLIDFYEVMNDKVVFYFEHIEAGESKTIHLDLKADIPGTYESPASCAYLYYENDAVDWVDPNKVAVLTN